MRDRSAQKDISSTLNVPTTPATCGGTGSSVKKDLKIGVAPFLP